MNDTWIAPNKITLLPVHEEHRIFASKIRKKWTWLTEQMNNPSSTRKKRNNLFLVKSQVQLNLAAPFPVKVAEHELLVVVHYLHAHFVAGIWKTKNYQSEANEARNICLRTIPRKRIAQALTHPSTYTWPWWCQSAAPCGPCIGSPDVASTLSWIIITSSKISQ